MIVIHFEEIILLLGKITKLACCLHNLIIVVYISDDLIIYKLKFAGNDSYTYSFKLLDFLERFTGLYKQTPNEAK